MLHIPFTKKHLLISIFLTCEWYRMSLSPQNIQENAEKFHSYCYRQATAIGQPGPHILPTDHLEAAIHTAVSSIALHTPSLERLGA